MSKSDLIYAKELIKEKRYDEARRILKKIDHPTAIKWLKKLDEIAPPSSRTLSLPVNSTALLLGGGAATGILITLVVVLLITGGNRSALEIAPIEAAADTVDSSAQIHLTETSESDAAMLADTVESTEVRSTLPPTWTPTDRPTSTLRPTSTPRPSATPNPYGSGSRSDPYIHDGQHSYSIGQGYLSTGGVLRDADDFIASANMFNEEAGPGEEWVLVLVGFKCDLTPNDVCSTSSMDFKLVSTTGTIYESPFATVVDEEYEFDGRIFGGTETAGIIPFIVDRRDRNFLLMYDPMFSNTRIFFEAGPETSFYD